MGKVIECLEESVETATPVDKWEKDITYDGKSFYYKNKKINTLSLEDLESAIRYLDFKGIFKRWSLDKEAKKSLLLEIWKSIPNNCYITVFGNRGVVTHGVKNSKNFVYTAYDGKVEKYEGSWYLGMEIDDGNSIILSKEEVPSSIKYADISNSFGKVHNFGTNSLGNTISKGKKINYDDDIVIVYKDGKVIYKGIEDDEPMKNEKWVWDSKNKCYTFKNYIKVTVDESVLSRKKIVEAYILEEASYEYDTVSTNPKVKSFLGNDFRRIRAFADFLEEWQSAINSHYRKELPNLTIPTIKCSVGKSYIKIHNGNSVMAFIDHFGNVYKAAGWKAPAKGVRYYIDSDDIKFDSYTSFLYGNSNLKPKTEDDWRL